MPDLDYSTVWEEAIPWERYLGEEIVKHRELWEAVYRRSVVPAWAMEAARALPDGFKLLVLSEDWCGDASNTVPVIARLAEAVPGMDIRILKRDEHPAVMDQHLTNGSRSVPLAIVLDAAFSPVGQWGPRPRELQDFVLTEKKTGMRSAQEIYRDVRTWYARDRGETTLREVLDVMAGAIAH